MRVEVTQILTRWLSHPEHGINALMQLVPRLKVDGSGSWDAPEPLDIYDDTMEEVVNESMLLDPPSTPCIVSFFAGETEIETKHDRKIAKGYLMASAFCTEGMATDDAIRIGGIAFRAQHLSLERFNRQEYSTGYKELNAVRVQKVGNVTEAPVTGVVGRSKMWGIIFSTLTVIDNFL